MKKIIIVTDFSSAARHAAKYTCDMMHGKDVQIDLLHIYPVPVTYTAEGIALASISEAIQRVENQMNDEQEYLRTTCPGTAISGRVITGSFLETLRNEALESAPELIVLGTTGFTELYVGDDDPLNALRVIPAPVLFIPAHAPDNKILQVAYPCNYATAGIHTPAGEITKWISFLGAQLHVLHVDKHGAVHDEQKLKGEQWLKEKLQSCDPRFYWKEADDLLQGVTQFIHEQNIDMLLVVPRKYGIWDGMFHQSRTKSLARFNHVPVMALHEQ